jgi:GrpB-like predicted nucleotidyltransferase (UPF0157 family)
LHLMRKVEIEPYDNNWPLLYASEAEFLARVLGVEMVRIHHIGSTSVPGLQAKPIIDMLAEVHSIEKIDSLNTQMMASGYTPMGEYGIAGRRYYYKGSEEKHSHHLHAFQSGNMEVVRHLLFRDYLRSHTQEARKYANLKESLSAKFPHDIEAYMDGKDAFIKDLDSKASAWSTSGKEPSDRSPKR